MVCKVGMLKSTAESKGILFFPLSNSLTFFFLFSKPGTIIPEQGSPIPDTTSLRQHSGEPPSNPLPPSHESILGTEGNSELSLGWGVCRGWEEYTNEAVVWIAVCVYRDVCVVQVLMPLSIHSAHLRHIHLLMHMWYICASLVCAIMWVSELAFHILLVDFYYCISQCVCKMYCVCQS